MMLPASKDLRAAVEQTNSERVYNQGTTNACGGYAVKAVIECLRELAGLPFRPVSAQWLYNRAREFAGTLDQDNGSGQVELSKALEVGFLFEDQFDPSLPRPSAQDALARETAGGPIRSTAGWLPGVDSTTALRRSIAMGLPAIICIPVGESLWDGISGDDWRTHSPTVGPERNTHWCVTEGYDDGVARTLQEDSSGPGAWDGGFFGLPYSLLNSAGYLKAAWRIEYIPSVPIVINDIGEMASTVLTKMDIGRWFDAHKNDLPADVRTSYLALNPLNFFSLARQAFFEPRPPGSTPAPAVLLLERGALALSVGGVPGLLAWCRENGITDLMLEVLAEWPRGQVRRYFDSEKLDPMLIKWSPQ